MYKRSKLSPKVAKQFIEACCEKDEFNTTGATVLWHEFTAWHSDRVPFGKAVSQTKFGRVMGELLDKTKVNGHVHYIGIRPKDREAVDHLDDRQVDSKIDRHEVTDEKLIDLFFAKIKAIILEEAKRDQRILDLEAENERLKLEINKKQAEILDLKKHGTIRSSLKELIQL